MRGAAAVKRSISDPVGITVAELVALPQLKTSVLAGHRGLERRVVSACVPDAREPWDFADPGDLVMTAGWFIPVDPAKQVAFVDRLDAEGLSGLVVSDDRGPDSACPPLSDVMLKAADRAGFPILLAEYSVPWTCFTQAVAAAASKNSDPLAHIMRIQNEVRLSLVERRPSVDFLAGLGRALGCRLYLVDPELWEPVLPGCSILEAGWRGEISNALAERGARVPTVIRLKIRERPASLVRVPVERAAFVLIVPGAEQGPRVATLQHLAAACALEITRMDEEIGRERRSYARLLSAALEGRVEANLFDSSLREHGLRPPWCCLVIEAEEEMIGRLARRWAGRGTLHALCELGPDYVAILQDSAAVTDHLAELAAPGRYRIGVSDPFSGSSGIIDASRQARWALETIPTDVSGLARYGNDSHAFLPRTLTEAEFVAQHVLDPMLAYDREHGTQLVKTLRAYLECDRSPSRAAKQLFVHNQTVNYRISRVEELTGRSMRSTRDISELWYGLRALAISEAPMSGDHGARREGRTLLHRRPSPAKSRAA